jgi:hypothetical protein
MTTPDLFERAYTGVCREAKISDCTRYRYWLKRWWSDDQDAPWVTWIMLNPSTADASSDDNTIRKCMSFARKWGAVGIYVVNLFAYRATDPKELLKVEDPIGPENAWAIRQAATLCKGPIVAAWGADKAIGKLMPTGWHRDLQQIVDRGHAIQCLKLTKDGKPWHPLYVPLAQPLIPFVVKGGAI